MPIKIVHFNNFTHVYVNLRYICREMKAKNSVILTKIKQLKIINLYNNGKLIKVYSFKNSCESEFVSN